MAETTGYHLLYLSGDHRTWLCPDTVRRQPDPNDPLETPTPNHFTTRAGANDYARRRKWRDGHRVRVEACAGLPACLRLHLDEWLDGQDPDAVAAWRAARTEIYQRKAARRRERQAKRKAAFDAAVEAEVAARLAAAAGNAFV